jgi:hypothetical protein
MLDANRTPVTNVVYGDRFRLNAHDIRTQAIVHPKVFGTTQGYSSAGYSQMSSFGQTLDQGVRIKMGITSGGPQEIYFKVEGATGDGTAAKNAAIRMQAGDEVFIETDNLNKISYQNSVSLNARPPVITFIAS